MGCCGSAGKKPVSGGKEPQASRAIRPQEAPRTYYSPPADVDGRQDPQQGDEQFRRTTSSTRVGQWLVAVVEPPNDLFPTGWLPVDAYDTALDDEILSLEKKYSAADELTPELARHLHRDYESCYTSTLPLTTEVCRAMCRCVDRIVQRDPQRDARVRSAEEVFTAYWRDFNVASNAKRSLDACREIADRTPDTATKPIGRNNIRLPCDVFEKGDAEFQSIVQEALSNLRSGRKTRARSSAGEEALSPEARSSLCRPPSVSGELWAADDSRESQVWSSGARAGSPRRGDGIVSDVVSPTPAVMDDSDIRSPTQ
eukprot:TRINITY_DN16095_c0_g1_i1.p1 TRINITY_DN16095_c0_g1~~TRINITY_DN16095_c0_g1_i1.p1  ORF type:complete len:313 (+),score=86.34 TRINITY_DN16095_c0_g1_i1:63-1001(+)